MIAVFATFCIHAKIFLQKDDYFCKIRMIVKLQVY